MKNFFNFDVKIFMMFLIIFSLYMFFALMGSFYNNYIYIRDDLFYDTDPAIKYNLVFMNSLLDIDRHPFIFIVTPVLKIISFIFSNPKLALILFQVGIATLNNYLLLIILKKINIREYTSIFFTLIYAFSFSTLLFVSFPEIYIYSSFIGLLLTYYILTNSNRSLCRTYHMQTFIISFLYVVGFGINLINGILYIPLIIYFLIDTPIENKKKLAIEILCWSVIIFSLFVIYGWGVYSSLNIGSRAFDWLKIDFSIQRLIQVLQETFVAPFYVLETDYNEQKIAWSLAKSQNYLLFFPFFMLIFLPFFYTKNSKNFSKIIWAFISIVLMHFIFNYFYNSACFLYSQNYLFLLIIILAYFYSNMNITIQKVTLSVFLFFQILFNFTILSTFFQWLNPNIFYVFSSASLMLISIISLIISIPLTFLLLKTES